MSLTGKVILIGDASVGKTSLLARYIDNMFRDEYNQTVGANFLIKEIELKHIIDKLQVDDSIKDKIKEKGFKLYFWDIGGQQDKLFVTEYYFYQSVGAMVVFNMINEDSLKSLDFWVSKLKELSGDIPFIIIGNKTDLMSDDSKIDKEAIKTAIGKYNVKFFETSAKLNDNIDAAFEYLSIQILNNLK